MSDIQLEGDEKDAGSDAATKQLADLDYEAYAKRAIDLGEYELAIATLNFIVELDRTLEQPRLNSIDCSPPRSRPILSAVVTAAPCGMPFARKGYGPPAAHCTRPRGHEGAHRR